jgi:L-lactate dehydrogenase (cytochrome)
VKRVPKFARDFLVGGIGRNVSRQRNRDSIHAIELVPRYLVDANAPDYRCTVWGRGYDAPFGVAPIGLGGLIWPRAAEILARAAKTHNIPFLLSTFATTSLETIHDIAGANAWFQLYVPNIDGICTSLIERARVAGYEVLVVTVDVPTTTQREHDVANGLSVPPRFDLRTLLQIAACPAWALATLRAGGPPVFENLERYVPAGSTLEQSARFLSQAMEGHITLERLRHIRETWPGRLVVKGVLHPDDARDCAAIGVDGLIVSNHGGRQLDAAPIAPAVLSAIRSAAGKDMSIMADGGVRSGLDVARMLAAGADFVLLGRAFMFAVAAIGARGGDHVITVLKEELREAMAQIGCPDLARLPAFLAASPDRPG